VWEKTLRLVSIQSRRQNIIATLTRCRQKTLDLLAEINSEAFYRQLHPDFSPIGWHFGHIALVESYWILENLVGLPPFYSEYRQLFAADGLSKVERQYLPSIKTIENYLATVREAVLDYLNIAPIETEERLWWWSIQHESQHNETIIFLWHFYRHQHDLVRSPLTWHSSLDWEASLSDRIDDTKPNITEMVKIPAGEFVMGSNEIYTQDNERPAHKINLKSYWIDRHPVTCQQYEEFIQAGGYQNSNYWSTAGWQWLQDNPVSQPLYRSDTPQWQNPVCGVNYYEAEAYANFAGKRLPNEAEWEKAATLNSNKALGQYNHDNLIGHTTPVQIYPQSQSIYGCDDMLGNVWEWTASWFQGYEGFSSYPYSGYSQLYFDNRHRVLRGGSWASRPWTVRPSFRNWYEPEIRQILAGFRCAAD
jgi:gamma-glutamyl hercynylcysteine S-oxide synthase